MKKIILTLTICFSICSISTLQAQKGFDKKKKTTVASSIPKFAYEEVPIPKSSQSARSGANGKFQHGIKANIQKIRVIRDQSGSVVWLDNPQPRSIGKFSNGRTNASQIAYQFLDEVKVDMGLKNPSESFEMTSLNTDDRNQTHIRMQQVYKNVPVYGGEVVLHTVRDTLRFLSGKYFPEPDLNVTALVNNEKAEQLAFGDVAAKSIVKHPADNLTKRFSQSAHELVIYHPQGNSNEAYLTWHITIHPNLIERWEYFVDAKNGAILDKFNHTCGVDKPVTASGRDLNNLERTFAAYQVGQGYYMIDASRPMYNGDASKLPDEPVGGIWTIDAANTFGDKIKVRHVVSENLHNWDATAVSAHQNAGDAYEYYRKTFQRNSLNGKGGTIISIINIADEEDGGGLDNAFWNGEFMGYGNGRIGFKPLAGGLDVAGHEMTHGVIQNSAGLEYQGQSGAINESMADVFGVLIDRDDWTVGEDVVKPEAYPSGALRSMSNPNQGGAGERGYQPKTMAQYVNTTGDNGGVHINSGIPNYAFYLIASKIGREKSELIYYRTLTQYLTRKSQFLDLRLAVIQSAKDLYGDNSNEVNTAKQAFDTVGITDGTDNPGEEPDDLPVNNGADGILVVGSGDDIIYQTTPKTEKFEERSVERTAHKPSVRDDGKVAYFVSSDKRIRAIALTGTPQEQVVSDETIWDNVAISRDGKKLAALTSDKDKSVYVYSFEKEEWKKFTLYNPTYSDGVTTGDVKYADAIVWDVTGEYLVYDAFNELTSVDGESHQYWDVGFLRVWDNDAKSFGDGNIEKLFTNLEDGENIGNPAYSKNSPNIISFDYMYEPDDVYEILGVDISKGDIKTIYSNNTLGFPDYSRKDDQMVFNTLSDGVDNVGIINLAADHISPSGDASLLVENGKLAVWYGQGSRETSKQSQTIQFSTITDRTIGDPTFSLTATASSKLTVTFEAVSDGVTIQGNEVKIIQAGKATVRAMQAGNDKFNAASPVDRTFCVNPTKPVVEENGKNYKATSQGASEYIWYEDGAEVYRNETGAVEIKAPGTFEVRANTADGCLSSATQVVVSPVLGNEPDITTISTPYPNPAKDELYLNGTWKTVPEEIVFTNISGRNLIVNDATINGDKLVVPVNHMTTGIYILKIKTGRKDLVYRILKE